MVSVEEYLGTSYADGDREYLDGVVAERNMGTPGHSARSVVHASRRPVTGCPTFWS